MEPGDGVYIPPYAYHWTTVLGDEPASGLSVGFSTPATVRSGEVHDWDVRARRLGLRPRPVTPGQHARTAAKLGLLGVRSAPHRPASESRAGCRGTVAPDQEGRHDRSHVHAHVRGAPHRGAVTIDAPLVLTAASGNIGQQRSERRAASAGTVRGTPRSKSATRSTRRSSAGGSLVACAAFNSAVATRAHCTHVSRRGPGSSEPGPRALFVSCATSRVSLRRSCRRRGQLRCLDDREPLLAVDQHRDEAGARCRAAVVEARRRVLGVPVGTFWMRLQVHLGGVVVLVLPKPPSPSDA